ncbi:hypothetical protein H4S02_002870 [Coemansia sp. RSA 2611]|nr:hypothetical protein IWW54_000651 [Coemansia sp. RSA 2705]KAJ2388432.1 hypothetical protein H4S02_002870 [Coemansia sp. RSA 2611]
MFGFGTGTAGTSAFGSAAPSGGLFGSSTSTAAPSTGLFGSSTSTAAPSTGMFGSSASTAAPSAGLFGSSTSTAAPSSGLFGGSTSAAAPSTGLFGSSTSTAAPSTSLFGGSTSGAAPSTGLFGGATSTAAPSTGLFGGATSTAAPSTGLFGGATSTAAPSTGLFGSSTSTAAPSTSLFGGSTSAAAAAASTAAAVTPKTKFADLAADMQGVLVAVERQKQVQIQIGHSIVADETEREAKAVAQAVQRLAQALSVAKLTLAGDRGRVDEAKAQAQFDAQHAERAAALVAHATDDGSWAQSGLTPLQAANRQRALGALQQDGGDARVGDPYEAVRRMQVASMHHDVARECYWAWLERVERGARLLQERLDQLERHVAAAVAHGGAQPRRLEPPARPEPRAVADVIQHQADSFLAIAARLAAVDEDVRRLRRRLALP